MKIKDLPLNELYARPKITASVEAAILSKENFSNINPEYCEKVCKIKCKGYTRVNLLPSEVDILIIQDHMAPKGKWDRRDGQQELIQRNIINLICKEAGFQGLTYRLTTLLKCAPNDLDFPRGKAPTATTLLKCRPYLYQEIATCRPKVIISLSTVVTKALGLKAYSNSNNRGYVRHSEYGLVVLSLHPRVLSMIRQTAVGASGFWSADYFEVVRRDFEKAAKLARGELRYEELQVAIDRVAGTLIHVCRTLDQVKQMHSEIKSLPQNALVSWDLETVGFNGFAPEAKILCSQFGYKLPGDSEYKSVVVPLWHRDNTWINPDEAWPYVADILTGDTKKTVWNGKFDCVYCYGATGVRVNNVEFDGLLMTHLLDSGASGTFSLKTAVGDFTTESWLQGYEDMLPKLDKVKPEDEVTDEQAESPAGEQDE